MAMLEAKNGKEHEVAAFLNSALPLVEGEPATVSGSPSECHPPLSAFFDVFNDETGRNAHLAREVAKALTAKAPELISQSPKIQKELAERPTPATGRSETLGAFSAIEDSNDLKIMAQTIRARLSRPSALVLRFCQWPRHSSPRRAQRFSPCSGRLPLVG